MVDFVEAKTVKTLRTTFKDPQSGSPIDVLNPTVTVGFYSSGNFNKVFESPLVKTPGIVGDYYKEVLIDPDVYAVNQFFYVRFFGDYNGDQVFNESTFRVLPSSEKSKSEALIVASNKVNVPAPEFYISQNSQINRRSAFLAGEFLGECDLWIEILDYKTDAPTNVYCIQYSIEDLTDCLGICRAESPALLVVKDLIPVHFGTGKYYVEWTVTGDGNPGPYMLHWDIMFKKSSSFTRISQGFHITKRKNMYDLNFQDPFSPTGAS